MRTTAIALLLRCCLLGCQKGDKGDRGDVGMKGEQGDPTLLSSKVYTGIPTSNPYEKSCPEITGSNNQTVDVFMVLNSGFKTRLNYSDSTVMHTYLTRNTTIGLHTYIYETGAPSTALYDPSWGQCSYRIEIRTFNSSQAASAYRNQKPHSTADYILRGEI